MRAAGASPLRCLGFAALAWRWPSLVIRAVGRGPTGACRRRARRRARSADRRPCAGSLLRPGFRHRAAVHAVRRPLRDRPRHPRPDLCHARLGAEHRGRPRRPARPRLRRLLRGRRLFLRAARADFGLGFWICLPLAGMLAATSACCWAFRCCGCAATISPSSRWASARSSASCCSTGTSSPAARTASSGIPRPTFFGLASTAARRGETAFDQLLRARRSRRIHRVVFLYYLILALALLTNFVSLRLRRLPIGRAWEALREDEIACRALGINTTNTKLTAFALGAMFGGFAGSFFATRRASSARRASSSSNRRSSSPSSCWAAWAARSASWSPRSC